MRNGQEGHGAPFGSNNGQAEFLDEFSVKHGQVGTIGSKSNRKLSGEQKSDGIQHMNTKLPGSMPEGGEGIYRKPK